MTNQQWAPEALRLADEWQRKTQREADRQNSAYDHYGMGNTPETVDPLGAKMANELRRLAALVEAQQPAPSAAETAGEVPLPLLVRDIAADLGTTPIQVCTALATLGFGGHSVNMAVTPRMAQSLRAHFASPTPQADSQPAPVRGYPPLPARRRAFLCTKCGGHEYEPGTLNETHPTCKCGYLGFAEDLDFTADEMRAYVDADRAARAPADSVTAPAGGVVAGPTSAHIAAMERAWLWMENQADGQSKGGHATFDLLMLREERDALRAAIDMEVTATCPHCNGTGEVFGHAENCTDDLCALNGDEHSCAGQVEHCQCAAAPTPPTQAQAGAVPPFTQEELRAAAHDYSDEAAEQCDFRNGARWACDRLGIKGGRHGESV